MPNHADTHLNTTVNSAQPQTTAVLGVAIIRLTLHLHHHSQRAIHGDDPELLVIDTLADQGCFQHRRSRARQHVL